MKKTTRHTAVIGWGRVAHDEWVRSFDIRSDFFMDEFVIMPNHVHGIVIIDKMPGVTPQIPPVKRGFGHCVPKSISSFVAGYKSSVTSKINDWIDVYHEYSVLPPGRYTKYTRKNRLWQRNFNDHIIRNEQEHIRIQNYIRNNERRWMGE